jgi:hypothetical protein
VSHEEQVERLIVLLETSSRNVIDLLSQPFEVVADEDNRHASAWFELSEAIDVVGGGKRDSSFS